MKLNLYCKVMHTRIAAIGRISTSGIETGVVGAALRTRSE